MLILNLTSEPAYYMRNSDMIPNPGSTIDTNSRFTFKAHRASAQEPRESWVPVDLPPSVPQSVISKGYRLSDWSSYKGSSVIVEQTREHLTDISRFSPYTTTVFTPRALPSPPAGRLNSLKSPERSAAFRISPTPRSESSISTVTGRGRAL